MTSQGRTASNHLRDTFSFFLADIGNGEVDFNIYDPMGT